MPQGRSENVRRSQPSARDKTHDLALRGGIALLRGFEDYAFHRVVTFGGFGDGATSSVRSRGVKELLATSGARCWVGGARRAQTHTNGLNKLVFGKDWPVVL